MQDYHVYILASASKVIYVGVTSDLARRVSEHKQGRFNGFTHRYRVHRLVYCEAYPNVDDAIAREKQIKRWRREKKVALIEGMNPNWRDLAERP